MKFCPSCGAKLAGVAPSFCSECGSRLADTAADRDRLHVPEAGHDPSDLSVSPQFYDTLAPIHDADRNWPAVFGTTVIQAADEWFGDPRFSTRDLFSEVNAELGASLIESGDWLGNAIISSSFALLPLGLPTGSEMNPRVDLRIPLTASPQGHRIERILAESGVAMFPWIGDEALVGWWASPGGGRVVQIAELMRNHQGREYLYWYSSPLFSLAAVPGNDVAFIGVTAAIPAALETICYLSECPTPLQVGALMLVGGRGPVLFGSGSEFPEYPRPVARLQAGPDPHSTNFLACTGVDDVTSVYFAGARIDLGLAIDLQGSDASVARSIQVAIASACRTAAILEDGFANHAEGELAFEQVLLSQTSVVDGGEQRWLPTSVAGYFMEVLTPVE